MTLMTIVFALSGAGVLTLLWAKRRALRTKREVYILNLISRSDERLKNFEHKLIESYFEKKEELNHFFKKSIPMQSKLSLHKFSLRVKEQMDEYIKGTRDVRLLKKSDNLSEFFKRVKEIEKGGGEINEELPTIATTILPPSTEGPVEAEKPKKKRGAPRGPRKKKLVVIEDNQ